MIEVTPGKGKRLGRHPPSIAASRDTNQANSGARRVAAQLAEIKLGLIRIEHAADLVDKIGAPNVRIQFDFYHNQIVGGDLIRRFEKYLPAIGHAQIDAVPTRGEPDEGEINYPAVFEAIDRLGYAGWIGCEYKPRTRTEDGLGWAKPYGVVPKRS